MHGSTIARCTEIEQHPQDCHYRPDRRGCNLLSDSDLRHLDFSGHGTADRQCLFTNHERLADDSAILVRFLTLGETSIEMSRDFLLVLGGGVVSLVTTLIVLFITDWIYRRDQARSRKTQPRTEETQVVDEQKVST